MTIISLIVAVDENNAMGYRNQLLCHLSADLKYFKEQTMGKPIVMGRKTFESIGKVLPGRLNIIISHQQLTIEGAKVVSNIGQALSVASLAPELMIIGGASIFEQTFSHAQRIYLTRIHHRFPADVFFPALDESQWSCQSIVNHPKDEKNPYTLSFYLYQRKVLLPQKEAAQFEI